MTPTKPAASEAADETSSGHCYPRDLAQVVRARWSAVAGPTDAHPLPDLGVLEHVLSVCYQASLLREEGRATTFRLALGGPEAFAVTGGPPAGLHRFVLTERRPLDEHELRRLAPVAGFQSSLIGAELDADDIPRIWGLLHSGQRWLQSVRGGREVRQLVPAVLIVSVTGPGRVLVSKGTATVAELSNGTLGDAGMDVLQAPWMADVVSDLRADPRFARLLTQHVLRRVLATIRDAQHGGTLILLPPHSAAEVLESGQLVLKYAFLDEEPRRRILTLTQRIIGELASLHPTHSREASDGWAEYEQSAAPGLAALDEALFEVAHFVAALAEVDGAVVLTTSLELLGFGGEIAGNLAEVATVTSALDLEATRREWVRTDRVGTRHRSAYRLCQAVPQAIVAVISQDGGLQFVRWHDGAVTYWTQVATGPWEV